MVNWEPRPRFEKEVWQVAAELKKRQEWLIVTHERPDGDAIGSALAMAHILNCLGISWTFLVSEALPERFCYLPFFSKATLVQEIDRTFDAVIAVDCADAGRFRNVKQAIAENACVVNIDHHQTNPNYGDVNLVDADAAATCELIYHVAEALDAQLQDGLAMSLYTGILTDTGGFAYPNTTRDVHQIAAELLACGVRPYDVAEPALEARSSEQMHLLQMALSNLTISPDGRYAALYVTRGMLEGSGANEDDVDGLVSFARSVDTVEVGVLFKETTDDEVKVSLRSKRKVDVSKIAASFGGGGHVRAAGCTLSMDLGDAMDTVLEAVETALAEVFSS